MQLQIRSKNFRLYNRDREYMERRIQYTFDRFSARISSVTVGLADLNGPRGGADKQCRLVVRMVKSGQITIEETSQNALAAVALAADRAGRAISRQLDRRRNTRHDRRSIHSSPDDAEASDNFGTALIDDAKDN
jgi:putative sigma-54 modulation protein